MPVLFHRRADPRTPEKQILDRAGFALLISETLQANGTLNIGRLRLARSGGESPNGLYHLTPWASRFARNLLREIAELHQGSISDGVSYFK